VAAKNSAGIGKYSENSASVTPQLWTEKTVGGQIAMRDNLTGLWWSRVVGWADGTYAMIGCRDLSYHGQNDWRVPSKEELLDAHTHQIGSQGKAGWIDDFNRFFKSDSGWIVSLSDGQSTCAEGGCQASFVCVRP
jgi:hypothetical protein